ncbi:DUF1292 domain-containing protein [Clostridium luticellarii]|jgi:hypothetical protein|uniref:DUF1292 domain-containing protein n=1 Tax=Clostridium luticellarii TaxID=1691940 RepID=A0A2T0B3U4_9CLOT|nr:DUF1292 domain-containing protein [Clostridium luticellarii]MCI1944899.1 DUF1292 domain-containing protein [Clostridium luticellarii]MCI1968425.1 DUF1292 domain-containing protein [Clostridium luticellarii]MCI1995423.1 DUF1292 domain-containing protein [Clostridium luticellarii]MCI2039486.1 DUF1292 domain-containing protein [Clostridium luticellarii]PRR78571.1 hypothetical protein CLLU_36370 [Clostridium luticellarii]
MDKVHQFIKLEKDKYGKIFVDISYAIDNISPFLDKKILARRKYTAKITTLKKYIELIDAAESDLSTKKFFKRLNADKYISLLESYKNDHLESFSQLEKCDHCECLNCTADCKFDSCLGCKNNSNIIHCDREKINITRHDTFSINLVNNRTGENDKYTVLATLQDVKLDKKYIIIENTVSKEKFILYYYPGISEDSYGEITDAQEFDFIVSTFQSVDE